jgi:hypothetical protein
MAVDLVAFEWIYSVLANDAALHLLIGDRIYCDEAPQDAAYPFVVYSHQGGGDVQGNAGRLLFVTEMVQVKAVGKDSYAPLGPIYDRVHALLHRQAGTVTNGEVVSCLREYPVKYSETDNGVMYRHMGGVYSVQTK